MKSGLKNLRDTEMLGGAAHKRGKIELSISGLTIESGHHHE